MASVVRKKEKMVSVTWTNGVAHLEQETVTVEEPGLVNFACYDYKFPFSGKVRAKRFELAKHRDRDSRCLHRQHGRRNLGQKPQYKTYKKGSPRIGRLLQRYYEDYCEFCYAERLYEEAMMAADEALAEAEELEREMECPDSTSELMILEWRYREEIAA